MSQTQPQMKGETMTRTHKTIGNEIKQLIARRDAGEDTQQQIDNLMVEMEGLELPKATQNEINQRNLDLAEAWSK